MIAARQIAFGKAKPSAYKVLRLKQCIDLRSQVMMPDGDVTICCWYKGYEFGSLSQEINIFGWRDLGWGGSRLQFETKNGIGIGLRYASGTPDTNFSITGDFENIAIGMKWHHLAFRKNGDNLSFLIDGDEIFRKVLTASHSSDGLPLSIGGIGNDSSSYYNSRRGDKSIAFFSVFEKFLDDSDLLSWANNRVLDGTGGQGIGLLLPFD